jgi:hypothetical protein
MHRGVLTKQGRTEVRPCLKRRREYQRETLAAMESITALAWSVAAFVTMGLFSILSFQAASL